MAQTIPQHTDNAGRPHDTPEQAVRADLEAVMNESAALIVLAHREAIEQAYADLDRMNGAEKVRDIRKVA